MNNIQLLFTREGIQIKVINNIKRKAELMLNVQPIKKTAPAPNKLPYINSLVIDKTSTKKTAAEQ